MTSRRWLLRLLAWQLRAWQWTRRRRQHRRLARAIGRCGYACFECESPVIKLHWAPALGWIPTIRHREVGGEWCPVLAGGLLAELESLDLLDSLAAVMAPLADYNEPVWHAREFALAAA